MSKNVISDFVGYIDISPSIIKESAEKNNGRIQFPCILQKADIENENKRIYSKDLLLREAEKFQKKIEEKISGGELDHPDSAVVNLKNVSHAIRKIWWDNDTLKGIIEILPTPSGKIVRELINNDIKLGISSRGIGSTKKDGNKELVQEDFELLTFDIVSQPSTPGAYIHTINENSEPVKAKKIEKYKKINDVINAIIELI